MGSHTYVKGIVPPDAKWKQMKAAYDACKTAGVEPPREVEEFFNYQRPNDLGAEIDIPTMHSTDDCRDFYDIDVSKLPPNIKIIRVVNSY